jgi:hypothetical protein
MVCDEVHVINLGLIDLPDVVVDETNSEVQICGSNEWRKVRNLDGVFVSIMSHESIHLVLNRIANYAAEALDNVGSLSVISDLSGIDRCTSYPNGLIGLDGFGEKEREGEPRS